MQCVIPSQNVRILVRGLHSLSRIGEDLYVEPKDEGLSFRTVNSAQSAYSSLMFNKPFFIQYKCEFSTDEGGKCKLSMKACLAVFKTPHCMDRNVDSCKIEIDKDCIKLIFQIRFIQGYTKNFYLSVADNELIQLKYSKEEMSNKMSILSKTLYGAIKHFRINDEEITLTVGPETARLKNYFENGEVNNQKVVRTNLSLQPVEFETYQIMEPGSITFALRELRAVCTFSELSNSSPVMIHFGTAGTPVIFNVRNNTMYEADYVVSTLRPEMMANDRPHRRSQLSDVISTMPSTSSTTANKKQKLAFVAEEPESLPSTTNEVQTSALINKSNVELRNSVSNPRVSLVNIIKYNDEQRQSIPSNTEIIKKNSLSNAIEQAPIDTDDYFSDDINNEYLHMICDQAEEMSRTQHERINNVFKYCYSYSPNSVPLLDSGEILCNASDIGVD